MDRSTPYPPINLARYEELVPKDGVYVTRTRVGGVIKRML